MDSTRQNKIARLIQKNISEILQTEYRNVFNNVMLTLTKVRVTPDLSLTSVYISIFGVQEKDKNMILEKINKHSKEIRKHLGTRVKNQLRVIPDVKFFIDDSLDYLENIEKLLKQ